MTHHATMEKMMRQTMIALASGVACVPDVDEFRLVGSGSRDGK
jgi:hypothetical protein